MLMSSLCDYSDTYTLAKETITVANTATTALNNVNNFTKLTESQFVVLIKVNINQNRNAKRR